MKDHLSFRLPAAYLDSFSRLQPDWGFPCGGGNTLGELTFLDKYSRLKPDGTKERWYEACGRVVEGTYSILKDHCRAQNTPWDEGRAVAAAEEMYERLFSFKWTPPGRGLWMMGTEFVSTHGSASLQNCAFLSTANLSADPTHPFTRLMEMSMLGVGVGIDTRGAGTVTLHQPKGRPLVYQIPDSREGWCKSVEHLLKSYFFPGRRPVEFNYRLIRAAGEPIKGFGGTAAGPGVLRKLHDFLHTILAKRDDSPLTATDIVDIANLIGKCVVSGSVRRSAEIVFGEPGDRAFVDLKNPDVNPVRMGPDGWGYLSNNSVFAEVGGHYDHLIRRIKGNGEPGLYYLDIARQYGRMKDGPNGKDYRVMGANPCVEQPLEDKELCTLCETFPHRHESLDDFKRTLKIAYLYAKAVTLLPTHWPDSNEVMQRNRRIGCSVTGIAQFLEDHDWNDLRTWMDEGYRHIQFRDTQYSEWLGVRESIKTTSVKPSGTVSLLAGATPGVHWPVSSGTYIRRMRFRAGDTKIPLFREAGYVVEPDVMDPEHTVVVEFPTEGPRVRSEREVTVWEKVHLAALMQEWWADNMVSATFTFQPEEADQIAPIIRAFDGQVKSMSFLPLGPKSSKGAYAQMPYESITRAAFLRSVRRVRRMDVEGLYANGVDAAGERGCDNDVCQVPNR